MRSRLGIAAVVGLDEVERARETDTPLLVFDHTIRWLYARSPGAVIVDWNRAAREIEGVKTLLCAESHGDSPARRDAPMLAATDNRFRSTGGDAPCSLR